MNEYLTKARAGVALSANEDSSLPGAVFHAPSDLVGKPVSGDLLLSTTRIPQDAEHDPVQACVH